jgi:hypothetical protein
MTGMGIESLTQARKIILRLAAMNRFDAQTIINTAVKETGLDERIVNISFNSLLTSSLTVDESGNIVMRTIPKSEGL